MRPLISQLVAVPLIAAQLGACTPDATAQQGTDTALTPVSAPQASSVVRATPLDLDGDDPGRRQLGALRYLGGYTLTSDDRDFGGLSAMTIRDGATLIVASDRTALWRVTLRFAADGALRLPERWAKTVLHGGQTPDGTPWQDAESLSLTPEGDLVLAFEHGGGVWQGDPLNAPSALRPLDLPADLRGGAEDNSGLEAVAALDDGRLVLLREAAAPDGTTHPGWLYRNGEFARFAYRPAAGFAPTGAARLGQTLYILERRFSLLGGFQARLARVALADLRADALIEGEELARLQGAINVDNFEGLAARSGPGGRHELLIVSDDNFQLLQRTLLLHFAISRS